MASERYLSSESPKLIGSFEHGDTITIDIYNMSDNSKVINAASCTEIDETGFFYYLPSSLLLESDFRMYFWIMKDQNDNEVYGELNLDGYPKLLENMSLGNGDKDITYTLTKSDLTPIANAIVKVTSDVAGLHQIAIGLTDQNGQVTFQLDYGSTVYMWRSKVGMTFTNPDIEVVPNS